MELVGPASRDFVHQAAGRLAELRALVAGSKTELGESIWAQLSLLVGESQIVQVPTIVVQAVDEEGVDLVAESVDVICCLTAGRPFDFQVGLVHAGDDERQIGSVSSIQGQIDDLGGIDHHAAIASVGFKQNRRRRNHHLLGNACREKHKIDSLARAHRHSEGRGGRVLEAGVLRLDNIISGQNARKCVVPHAIADGCFQDAGAETLKCNRNFGHHSAVYFSNGPDDTSAIELSTQDGCGAEEKKNAKQASHRRHRTPLE